MGIEAAVIVLPDGTPYEGPVALDAWPLDPFEEAAYRMLLRRISQASPSAPAEPTSTEPGQGGETG
jgi:hypothetical protein